MNLREKLIEIQKALTFQKKDSQGYGYKYVSGSSILADVRREMDKHDVMLQTSIENITPVDGAYIVTISFTWVSGDQSLKTDWNTVMPAEKKGMDAFQLFGAMLTYNERYFLLKYFHIPTDENDPDAAGKIVDEINACATESELMALYRRGPEMADFQSDFTRRKKEIADNK